MRFDPILWLMFCVGSLAVCATAALPGTTPEPLDAHTYQLTDEPSKDGSRCYHCEGEDCRSKHTVFCPAERSHCGTIARSPNFTSTLSCAAANSKICELLYIPAIELQFSCVCEGEACNSLFTQEIQKNLLHFFANFTNFIHMGNESDYTDLFFKVTGLSVPVEYNNLTRQEKWQHGSSSTDEARQIIGLPVETSASPPGRDFYVREPLLQALKQDTILASDDEDEGEGSGEGGERWDADFDGSMDITPPDSSPLLPTTNSSATHITGASFALAASLLIF